MTTFKYLLHLITTSASSWLVSIASEHLTLQSFLAENYFTIKCLISPDLSGLFFKSLSTRHFSWTSLVFYSLLIQAHINLEIVYFNRLGYGRQTVNQDRWWSMSSVHNHWWKNNFRSWEFLAFSGSSSNNSVILRNKLDI